MKKIIALVLSLTMITVLPAQDVALGQWKSFLPFKDGISAAQSETEVFIASESMIAIIDKAERSVQRIDKVNGLNDVNIRVIQYDGNTDILLIAYENGNLDLRNSEGAIFNISDIKRNTTFNVKNINHISFSGNFAYLSCNFGIVKLDLERKEVKDTYPTGSNTVNAAVEWNGVIYASTEDGIFESDPNANLSDFNTWKQHSTAENIPFDYFSKSIVIFENTLYADVKDSLRVYNGTQWNHLPSRRFNENPSIDLPFFFIPNYNLSYLETSLDGQTLTVNMTSPNGFAAKFTSISNGGDYFEYYNPQFYFNLGRAIRDQDRVWWIADKRQGIHSFNSNTWDIDPIPFNAPYDKNIAEIAIEESKVWAAAGAVEEWSATVSADGTYILEEGFWDRVFPTDNPDDPFYRTWDHITVAHHPTNDKIYIGSFTRGVIEIDGDQITLFNELNSSLQPDVLDPGLTKVSGMAFDNEGNLWISNYGALRPISVLKADGSWQNFTAPSSFSRITQVVVDLNGYKWFASPETGILVFDEGDITVDADDRLTTLTSSNTELPVNDVNCLVVDKDGEIWVGTTEGTMVFECPFQVFDGECPGRRVVVEADDFGDYLLKTQNIKTIAVDGADRKWFGTTSGIFVQSEDGEEDILSFNVNNSPLFSNIINDIAIDGQTGEVYIATDQGLLSYRSDALEGGETFAENITAFPNPVRPDYEGPIAIRGLIENANVKITDIKGQLVYETRSLGGQALWDGTDYTGRRAASGVYLVFSSSRDGQQAVVAKLLFLN